MLHENNNIMMRAGLKRQMRVMACTYTMHYGHFVYGATFLGRPNFALNAAGAPGFMTAGLQLF